MGLFDWMTKKNQNRSEVQPETPIRKETPKETPKESPPDDTVFEGTSLPNWSTDTLTMQKPHVADEPPDVTSLLQQALDRAGRGSMIVGLSRLYTLLGAQIDLFADTQPRLRNYDLKTIRNQLMTRPDFDVSMFFTSLTYFGVPGVAINNELIQQVPSMIEALEAAASEGALEEDSPDADPTRSDVPAV